MGNLGRRLSAYLRRCSAPHLWLLLDRLRSNLRFVHLLVLSLITFLLGCRGEATVGLSTEGRPGLRGSWRDYVRGSGTKLSGRHAGGVDAARLGMKPGGGGGPVSNFPGSGWGGMRQSAASLEPRRGR